MNYTMRPLAWDQARTPPEARKSRYAFRAGWADTLKLLGRELEQLDGANVIIEADFREGDLRLDGMPRANARQPEFPGVRISFDSRHGRLVYATDAYEFWQHNVRAVGLSLEALRAVDRYGATRRAEQYAGWQAIDAGPSTATAVDAARKLLLELATQPDGDNSNRALYRRAALALHPDQGGTREDWDQLQHAKAVLGL